MPGMRMWRAVILAVACLQVLLFAVGLSLYPRLGEFGFSLAQDGRRTVNPNAAAYQAGLRSGDMPDASVAVAALQTPLGLAHQRLQVTIYRNGRPVRASIIARPATYPWSPSVALRNFIGLVLLILGAFIVIRGDVTARTMWTGTFLVLTGWVALLQYLAAPKIAGIAGLQAGNLFYALSLLAAVAILFTFDVATDARLRVCSLACALACAVVVVAEILTNLPSTVVPAWRAGLHASWLAPMLVATCYIVAVLGARGEQRRRLRVFATAVVPFCVVIGLGGAVNAFGADSDSVTYIARVFELTLPFGMAYALFVRRVIDIGFAISRAVVFGLVSAVLVAIFVLIEWAGAEWLNRQSHTTNLAIGAGVALVLGLSMRFIHGKIDKFVDTVFFRKRHKDEQSLRRFAHEAAFITDAKTLVERALEAVCMQRRRFGCRDALTRRRPVQRRFRKRSRNRCPESVAQATRPSYRCDGTTGGIRLRFRLARSGFWGPRRWAEKLGRIVCAR